MPTTAGWSCRGCLCRPTQSLEVWMTSTRTRPPSFHSSPVSSSVQSQIWRNVNIILKHCKLNVSIHTFFIKHFGYDRHTVIKLSIIHLSSQLRWCDLLWPGTAVFVVLAEVLCLSPRVSQLTLICYPWHRPRWPTDPREKMSISFSPQKERGATSTTFCICFF